MSASTTGLCEYCKAPATTKCAACPSTDPTFYCSKTCQKQDWSRGDPPHKAECRKKQVYAWARPRTFQPETVGQEIARYALSRGAMMTVNFVNFFRDIPVEARALKMGGDEGIAGILTEVFMRSMAVLRKTTKEAHVAHVASLGDKYKDIPEHLVPLHDRPIAHGEEDGRPTEGLPQYPQDFRHMSLGLYLWNWRDGRGVFINPFGEDKFARWDELEAPPSEQMKKQIEEKKEMSGIVFWAPY